MMKILLFQFFIIIVLSFYIFYKEDIKQIIGEVDIKKVIGINDYKLKFVDPNIKNRNRKKFEKDSYNKEFVREILQNYFQEPFFKSTDKSVDLDGYNKKLNLAFEYNDKRHYEYPNYKNQSYAEFKDLQEKDKIKIKTCEQKGINLLVVPFDISEKYMRTYVTDKLIQLGYNNKNV